MITLEQARALDAVARHGSLSKAAQSLKKGHTSLIYLIKTLEDGTGLQLFDRSGYRTSLTPIGKRVWHQCQKLLQVEEELDDLCKIAKSGYEPYLQIVYDGLFPISTIIDGILSVRQTSPDTKVSLYSSYLGEVEEKFVTTEANLMISILQPQQSFPIIAKLNPIQSVLVAHRTHPLTQKNKTPTIRELQSYTFLTVRGSDQRLQMSTSALDKESTFHLSDFQTKKMSLLRAIGYGWMPEYLIRDELKSGELKVIRWEGAETHTYHPIVYGRNPDTVGQSSKAFIEGLIRK